MESAENILRDIVRAIQDVQNATNRYSMFTTRGVRQAPLLRLQLELRIIADVSRAILEVFGNPLLHRRYILDDRFIDWLCGPEPDTCLDTLKEMTNLLNVNHDIQASSGLIPTKFACREDDMNRAIALFHTNKPHFHFLLTSDIWNYEKDVLRQTLPSNPDHTWDVRVHGHEEIQTTSTKNTTMEHQRKEIISLKLKKLLEKLDPVNCSAKHQQISAIRQPGTCIWLPATDGYQSWKQGKGSFLWLQGKAGAGKSVLASSVINDLNDTKKDSEILVYFYCDFRTRRSTSAIEVMRSLLAELTKRLCDAMMNAEKLLDELLNVAINVVDPFYNVKGLSHYLVKVARSCPQKPLIVVDALDECKEVESLLDCLIMSSGDVRIFLTSRPLQNVIKMLAEFPCISLDKMANELSADILLHATRELDSRHRLRTFDGRLRKEIRSMLCAKANGMFRWVQCQLDTLDKCASVSEIRRVLKSLPEGLEETYRRILIRIDKRWEYSRLVRRGLVWLVTTLRPMRLQELLEAVTIDPVLRALDPGFLLIQGVDFLEVSRSLVIHHKETDIVSLSHMSVKEYLVGELIQDILPQYHIVLEDAHEQSAKLCMAYIAFCLSEMEECRDKAPGSRQERDLKLATSDASRPFLNYVLSYGFRHLTHLGPGNTNIFMDMEILQKEIRRYAPEWDQLCELVPSSRSGIPWASSEHDFTMYTLIAFSSDVLFHTFLGLSSAPMSRHEINPLVYAAHFGKTEHARALIFRGANVNNQGLVVDKAVADDVDGSGVDESCSDTMIADFSDKWKATPIQVAVEQWHVDMVDLLLAEGCTISDELLNHVLRVFPHEFPPYIILRLLQTTEFVKWAVAPWDHRRLLEAFVADEGDYGQTYHEDELTLATKALVQIGCAEALLLIAVKKGCIPVIETLLCMHASLPSDTPSGLLHGIANLLAVNGDTPLHIAMELPDENQCLLITKMLVDAGCNPCNRNADDRPPIQVAVGRGFVSVVKYLLSLDVPLPARILFTASQATYMTRVDMVRLLVSKGANVHLLSPSGDGLLHTTMRSPYQSVCFATAEILIEAGCSPFERNLCGETPLQIAAKKGFQEIVNYLMLSSSSSDILTLLQDNPAEHVQVLRSLIGNTDFSCFSPEEEDRVFAAVRQFIDDEDRCLKSTKIFIGDLGGFFVRSSASGTLFHIAVARRFRKVVEYLISQSVLLPPAILFAALRCQEPIISLLIRNGADVDARKDNGDTLFHVTMSSLMEPECRQTTQVLVEAGCDPFMFNAVNQQPIHIAASRGFFFVVEYLMSHAFKIKAPLPLELLLTVIEDPQEALVESRLPGGDGINISYLTPGERDVPRAVLGSIEDGTFLLDARSKEALRGVVVSRLPCVVDYLLSRKVPLPSGILLHALQPLIGRSEKDAGKWISMISLLVRNGADVRIRDAKQNALLHLVMQIESESHCLEVMKALIQAGSSALARNIDGRLPIEVAVIRRLPSIVEFLLTQNVPLPSDILHLALQPLMSPLREDAEIWILAMTFLLIRKGANVHVQDERQNTLLHLGMRMESESHCLEVTEVLIQAGCSAFVRNIDGQLPIEVAVVRRLPSVVEFLLSHNVPLPSDILLLAFRPSMNLPRGDAEILAMTFLLIRNGADVHMQDEKQNTLLHLVMRMESESHCLEVTKVLMQAGCSAFVRNVDGQLPIEVAVICGLPSVVEFFLSQNAPLPSDILLFASQPSMLALLHKENADMDKRISTISLLIRNGADVHAQDSKGNSLLHLITQMRSESHCLEATKIYLEAGCSASACNGDDELPIEVVVTRGLFSVAEFLLSRNAPFPPNILLAALKDHRDEWGFTKEAVRMVCLLVEHGADVCATTAFGDSALHAAISGNRVRENWGPFKVRVYRGHLLEIVKILVQAGCDVHAYNENGFTPAHLACDIEVKNYLSCVSTVPRKPQLHHSPPASRRPPTLHLLLLDSVRWVFSNYFSFPHRD